MKSKILRFVQVLPILCLTCFAQIVNAERQVTPESFGPLILKPEDQLGLSFPGAPELNTNIQIRRDGYASMPLVGEVFAAGKTPREFEEHLYELYESQLVTNEVMVTVLETHFTYYLEGQINSPGMIQSFRQLSLLEAIIAAGGIDKTTGKLNSIVVLRRDGDKYQRWEMDLKAVLDGKKENAFILEPYDIVSVPQRIW